VGGGRARKLRRLRGRGEEEEEEEEEEEGGMRVYGYRYITGGRGGARGTSVCVQKGEKEGHILYLWVFAATVLSRRRLAAEELTDVLSPCPPPPPCPCPPPVRPGPFDTSGTSFRLAPAAGRPALAVSVRRVRGAGRSTGGRTMCHLRCHPIFRSCHDMLRGSLRAGYPL